MAFGKLLAPDENTIRAVYLGPQQHTSLRHTTRLLGNRSLWQPGIGGGLWINGENTSVSTECSGQAATHRYSKTKKREDFFLNERNIYNNCLCPTQLLEASRITEALEKYAKWRGWREEWAWKMLWFTSVCLCGRHSFASSRLLQLLSHIL